VPFFLGHNAAIKHDRDQKPSTKSCPALILLFSSLSLAHRGQRERAHREPQSRPGDREAAGQAGGEPARARRIPRRPGARAAGGGEGQGGGQGGDDARGQPVRHHALPHARHVRGPCRW